MFLVVVITLVLLGLAVNHLSISEEVIQVHKVRKDGTFFLVGGGMITEPIRERFLKLAGGDEVCLVIIPCAAEHSEKSKDLLIQQWKPRCVTIVDKLVDAYKIRSATGVWISGGDQLRLVNMLIDTPVEQELRNLYARGGVIGGTSAGASACGKFMPYENECRRGFGFIDYLVIDQHFSQRSRQQRLRNVIAQHTTCVGLGIDEETAVVIRGNKIEIIGKNFVTIFQSQVENKYGNGQTLIGRRNNGTPYISYCSEEKPSNAVNADLSHLLKRSK